MIRRRPKQQSVQRLKLIGEWSRMLSIFGNEVRLRQFWVTIASVFFLAVQTVTSEEVTLEDARMSSENVFEFSFRANSGQTYPISVSTDLLNWTRLTNAAGIRGLLPIR